MEKTDNETRSLYRRFLNIRLDSIKVADEARHPHMVRAVAATEPGNAGKLLI